MKKIAIASFILIFIFSSVITVWGEKGAPTEELYEEAPILIEPIPEPIPIPDEPVPEPTPIPDKPLPDPTPIPDRPLPPIELEPINGGLSVSPKDIDISSSGFYSSFEKQISIKNLSENTTTVTLSVIEKTNFEDISISPTKLTLTAGETRQVTIKGRTPSEYCDFEAKIKMTSSASSTTDYCKIHGKLTKPVNSGSPLSIMPHNFDMNSSTKNTTYSKELSIYNPNNKTAKAYINVASQYGSGLYIKLSSSSISIPAFSTKKVPISITTPMSNASFGADIEVSNNLNTSVEKCVIYGDSGLPNEPTNIKITYDKSTKDYTITWDVITGMKYYKIYTRSDNKWKVIAEVPTPKYVRNNVDSRQAKTRYLIRGADYHDKTGPGAIAQYTPMLTDTPKYCSVRYSFPNKKYTFTWSDMDLALGYNVYIKYPGEEVYKFNGTYTEPKAVISGKHQNHVYFMVYPIGPDGVEGTHYKIFHFIGASIM